MTKPIFQEKNYIKVEPRERESFYFSKQLVSEYEYGLFVEWLRRLYPRKRFFRKFLLELNAMEERGELKGFSEYFWYEHFQRNHKASFETEQTYVFYYTHLYDLFRVENCGEAKTQPIYEVVWYAAKAYCLWRSLQESNGRNIDIYRLQTEKDFGDVADVTICKRLRYDGTETIPYRYWKLNESNCGETPWEWMEDFHCFYKDQHMLRREGFIVSSGHDSACRCDGPGDHYAAACWKPSFRVVRRVI
jgi:hypothetical protein